MLAITIRKAAPWNEPTGLRYIQGGVDGLGTAAHLPPQEDLAEALNWFYGVVSGNVTPPGGGFGLINDDNDWNGNNNFLGGAEVVGLVVTGGSSFDSLAVSGQATFQGTIAVTSHPETRTEAAPPVPISPGVWSGSLLGSIYGWLDGGNSGSVMLQPLDLPHGQLLTSVTVSFAGANTDVALPSTGFPTLKVFFAPATNMIGGSTQLGSTATDAPANLAAYTAEHDLSVAGLSHTIDRTANVYFAVFTSEHGTNSHSSLLYLSARHTVTRTTIVD